MRARRSPYEVRCPRCDVSFPVETRRCIHCGGPTASSDAVAATSATPAPTTPTSGPPAPIGIETEGSYPWSRRRDARTRAPSDPIAPGAEAPAPDEATPSLGASLLRSFGSLFWIIALIGFSIMRSCSEG